MTVPRAVLAVVVRKPGTLGSINDDLIEVLPEGRWEGNEAHKAVPRMEKEGLVCVGEGSSGEAAGLRWYEATQLGVEQHHDWMGEPAALPPALRDPLQAKLEFVQPRDLPGLHDAVREEEEACAAEYQRAHRLHLKVQHDRLRGVSQSTGWEQKRLEAKLADEAVLWQFMALRLKKAREQLVEMGEVLKDERRERGDRG